MEEPRSNNYLLGHENAEHLFLEAWKNNSLHNSWLISGIKGCGKATFAYKLARFILSADWNNKEKYSSLDISPDSAIFKQVSTCSHPDFKVLERDFTDTERRKIIKAIKDGDALGADELKDMKKSAFIRVDDVRLINEFLSKRSSQDGWRVVVVDSVDDMNGASANAILKILEEPPYQTLMLLISHNPARLLPTIRSRCTKLELKPLSDSHLGSLLRRYRPELSESAIKKVTAMSSGSIGKAINYADNNATERYDALCGLVASGSKFRTADVLDFCADAVSSEESYYLTQELLLKFLSEAIKSGSNPQGLAEVWENAIKTFVETETLNMDKKQALITIIVNICKQF